MITTAIITMQFGVKPLFENVSIKFGEGNRYGLIGANGYEQVVDVHENSSGNLKPTAGNVLHDSD